MATTNLAEAEHGSDAGAARAEQFERTRPLLFSLAYRMLGSVVDAEDAVQEAYLRWHRAAPSSVEASRAYLCSIVTHLCIDHLKSARVRREEYVGPWLPEPLLEPLDEDPLRESLLAESLSTAFLLLLERLSPLERAVFLLREVFSFEYAEVAGIVGRSEPSARQLAKRARDRVAAGRARAPATRADAERLTRRFVEACGSGDLAGLLELLAEDVVTLNDGGGKERAARNPVCGRDRVARFYVGLFRKWTPMRVRVGPVNGQPGLFVRTPNGKLRVVTFEIRGGRFERIFLVANPDKLHRVPPGI